MARKITYSRLKSMSDIEISKLSTKDGSAQEMLKQFREKFRYREKAFNRAGKNVYSPALEKMESYYDRNGERSPEEMTVHQIRSELFHIQEFFKSKTSDVKGAREVMREQDIRIFGESGDGFRRDRGPRASRHIVKHQRDPAFVRDRGEMPVQPFLCRLVVIRRHLQRAVRAFFLGMFRQLDRFFGRIRAGPGHDIASCVPPSKGWGIPRWSRPARSRPRPRPPAMRPVREASRSPLFLPQTELPMPCKHLSVPFSSPYVEFQI